MIQHQLLNHADQVSDGVELKKELETIWVGASRVKNRGHEHPEQQHAPQPMNGVPKIDVHGRKNQTQPQNQDRLHRNHKGHQDQMPTQPMPQNQGRTTQHGEANHLVEHHADDDVCGQNNGREVQLFDQMCMVADRRGGTGEPLSKSHPSDHACKQIQGVIGPTARRMKLHPNQHMKNKGVGAQLQQRCDHRPKEPDGASCVAVAQILEDESPQQTPMTPQLHQATAEVQPIARGVIHGLRCGAKLGRHTQRVSQPPANRRWPVQCVDLSPQFFMQRPSANLPGPLAHLVASLCLLATMGCQEHKISAFNSTPEAQITSHTSDDAIIEGVPVTFRGMVTDDDDRSDRLTTHWMIGVTEACTDVAPSADGSTFCELTLGPEDETDGQTRVSLTVLDPQNASATVHLNLAAIANIPPTVSIISPAPDASGDPPRFYADQAIDLIGTVSDAEDSGSTLGIVWESTIDGVLPLEIDVESDGAVVNASFLSEGHQTLSLRVTDSGGLTRSDQVLIEVVGPNTPPTCTITIPGTGTIVHEATPITFSGTAADANETDLAGLQARWESDRDGVLNTDPPSAAGLMGFSLPSLTPGEHQIHLSVTDDGELGCADTISLSVRANPTIISTSPSDDTVLTEGESVMLLATVTDVEDRADQLSISWTSAIDGPLGSVTADTLGLGTLFAESLSPGTHTITVTVTDTDGMFDSVTHTIRVNQPPTQPVISLSPEAPSTADDLRATIDLESIDPEGAGVSYRFVWRLDGALSLSSTTDLLPTFATQKGQEWQIEITPTDGEAEGPSATASVVIQNSLPTVSTATISPATPLSTDTLTCSPSGIADADGDPVSLSTLWIVNGTDVDTGTDTLGPTLFPGAANIQCRLTPHDDEGSGESIYSASVSVNAPPVLHGIWLSPTTATVEDTLVCDLGLVTDTDGDPVSIGFEWFSNGIDLGVSIDSLSAEGLARDDVLHCQATPHDGHEPGDTLVSESLTLTNAPPSISTITISPDDVRTNTVLTASVSTSDADLDPLIIEYTWLVNSAPLAGLGPSLDGALYFDKDDTVSLSAVVHDGVDSSLPWVTDPVVVQNTAPATPSVSIAPESPAAAVDDLICNLDFPPTDDDLDGLTYTITWTRDGEAFTATTDTLQPGDTIPGHVTWAGELWSCTIVAHDGTDSSPPASAEISPEWQFTGWGDEPFALTDGDAHLVGTSLLANAGEAIANAGDLDGDGMLDMLVGAPQNDERAPNAGKAYLVLASDFVGSDTILLPTAYQSFEGVETNGRLGFALAGNGNVGGDDRPDVVIGAYGRDVFEPDDGMIGVFWDGGPPSSTALLLDDADVILHGGTDRELAGYALAFIPDMDGDSLDELLVGAPHNDSGGSRSGAAYLVAGAELNTAGTIDLSDMPQLFGETGLDRAGDKVRSAGDVDTDGITDLLISAPFNETGGNKAGRVYVIYGVDALSYTTLLLTDADIRIEGEQAFDEAGTGLSGGHDIDGDGAPEIIIGAPLNDAGANNAGRVYIFWGASLGMSESVDAADADIIFTSTEEAGQLGTSVSAATDVDDDSLADVLIGFPGSNIGGPEAGAALLFQGEMLGGGGVFSPDDASFVFYGTGAADHAGETVLGMGDIDGDGFGDIAVSEPDDTTIYGNKTGTVHLLFAP